MATASTLPLSVHDVLGAYEQIRMRIHRTPVLTSRTLNDRTQTQTFLKCENFQRGGSFKVRGAMHRLVNLKNEDPPRGVVAFSSGNHAQGVAIAARDLGISATIVMPADAPMSKRQATAGYGAEIVTYDRRTQDREAIARDLAATRGLIFVPPYDHPQIMAGQGTLALELLDEVPDLDLLLVPVGGGGLISGCATLARARRPQIRIYGVEVETGNDTYLSLQAGHRITIPLPDTIADGIRTTCPGALTFEVVRQCVDGILLVSDAEILEAMRFLLLRLKILVEPTGAVAVAALLTEKINAEGQRVGIVISGGNVDPEVLCQALS